MNRIYWHKFAKRHPNIFKKVENVLHNNGFALVLVFDEQNTCHDAFIQKRIPSAIESAKPSVQ